MVKKRTTMKDVARRAGVTQPTVSHVINGTASISKEVRDRVNRVIEEMDYRPNAIAKGLKTNKTNIVGIIIPDIMNGYYTMMVMELERALKKRGYASFLSATGYQPQTEELCVHNLLQYNVEGVIICYQLLSRAPIEALRRARLPFVCIEDGEIDDPGDTVRTDNVYGGYLATRHLLDAGYQNVAFVSESLHARALQDRFEGYRKALEERHMPLREELVLISDGITGKFEIGRAMGRRLLAGTADALFCTTDAVAFGVMRSLFEAGKQIPHEYALVGYDDSPMAPLANPALTTVSQEIPQVIALAMGILFARMSGEKRPEHSLVLPKLVVRETA